MKKLALVTAFLVSAAGAQAQQRPSAANLACGQAKQLVFSRGGVVISTGTYTYDRYVRDRSFCEINEYTEPAWVQTRDTPQCFIGYRCVSDPPFFMND